MKLVINVEEKDEFLPIDVHHEMSLIDFKTYIESETNISPDNQILVHNSKYLENDVLNLKELGLKDEDLITLRNKTAKFAATAGPSSVGSSNFIDPIEQVRNQILCNDAMREQLKSDNSTLYNSLNDPQKFKQLFEQSYRHSQNQNGNEFGLPTDEINKLYADPDSEENQKKIMQLIQQQQINENMDLAYEQTPENFVSVNMLYVDVEINGHKAKAFVDTGAQTTIISPKLAEECGLSNLIDVRFRGEARGVGKAVIIGKIHSAPLKIGDQYFPCGFNCLDTHVDLLLGLDMLRRHHATINLFENKLVIGDTSTRFLNENEAPTFLQNPDTKPQSNSANTLGGNIFSDAQPTGNIANSLPSANTTKLETSSLSASSSAAAAAGGAADARRKHVPSESSIQQLVGLGFSRQEAWSALEQCDGNVDLAASLLFQ